MNISRRGYRILRIARITVSIAVMTAAAAGITLGAGSVVSRWQVIPALMACSVLWLMVWAAVTLIAGRLYCSVACPLGAFQDCFIAVSRRRRRGFHYRGAAVVLRRSVLVIAVICGAAGFPIVTGLLDPAAAFSRICTFLASPAVRPMTVSAAGAAVAAATLAVAAWVSLTRGRRLCNTICPVGTLLGGGARLSLYHFDINTDLCTGCNRCIERCKSECIDPSGHTVDASRCVVCFDCAAACPTGAITLRRGRHRLQMPLMETTPSSATACSAPLDRRKFLSTLIVAPAALSALARNNTDKPLNAVTPPGSGQKALFDARCTGCGECMAACPSGIIRPATRELGMRRALHPVLDFDMGACIYECVKCTEVCPTGALTPMTPGEKRLVPIGRARLRADRCIEYTDGTECGRCARRCPAGAITIVPVTTSREGGVRRLPRVKFDDCIGCGACRYVCPGDPKAWIIEAD